MKAKLISLLLCLAFSPALSWGDVEVLNHPLSSGQTYTVPDGLILLLEAAVNNNTGSGNLTIEADKAGFAFDYSTNTSLASTNGPRQALYLDAGTKIRADSSGGRKFVIFGRLLTPNELYASTDPSADIELSGDSAIVVAEAESKRPVRFEIEESTDLISWVRAVVTSFSTSRDTISVEIASGAEEKSKFVRAIAKEVPIGRGG